MTDQTGSDSGVNLAFDFTSLDEELLNELFNPDLFFTTDDQGSNYYQLKSKPMGVSPPTTFKSASNVNRTSLKQILQREQVQEQERREQKRQRSSTTNASSSGNAVTNRSPVSVPAKSAGPLGTKMDVPREVLKAMLLKQRLQKYSKPRVRRGTVHTRLHNPTHYHVVAEQKRQLQEFLNTTQDGIEQKPSGLLAQSMPNVEVVPSPLAPYMSSSAPSPDSPNSVALSSSAATSASEADVIESIIQMQADLDSDSTNYLQMSTVPGSTTSLLDVYKLKPSVGPTAKSCPTEVATLNGSLSVVQLEQYQKERIKKDNHNMIERRRRYNINDRIKELATLLPRSSDPHRQNKGTILKESVDYIKQMNTIKHNYESEIVERKRLEQENKKLKLLNQQLLLQFHLQAQQPEAVPMMNELIFDSNIVVKQEPLEHLSESDLSRATIDDIMDDDRHPVTGDPMLAASGDIILNDEMDFIS